MIQRIQSVYLLLVTILLACSAFFTLGYFSTDSGLTKAIFNPMGVTVEQDLLPTWALFTLLIIGAVIALVTIFLFKNRPLQLRLCIFNTILMLGYYGALIFFIFKMKSTLASEFFVDWKICLPLVALILNYLAIRGIGKDEVLVRSYDRIR